MISLPSSPNLSQLNDPFYGENPPLSSLIVAALTKDSSISNERFYHVKDFSAAIALKDSSTSK
jgi:hypothetical protein